MKRGFLCSVCSTGRAEQMPVDYDGEFVNLAVGYDLDEDDKLGLSWTSYSVMMLR